MADSRTAQERVAEFTREFSLDAPLDARLLDLNAEAGELAKELFKATSYGQKEFYATPEWQQELGDVYFSLLALADKSEVNLEASLDDAMRRYADRVHEIGMAGNPENS
jgi:NTP pyrophosphatase (non-canonical NTP hydrolase)